MPSAVRELRVFQAQDAVRRGGEGCDGTRERSERERNLCKKKSVLRLKERSPNVCPTRCFASNWIMGTLFSHTFPEKCASISSAFCPETASNSRCRPTTSPKDASPTGSSKPARRAPARGPRAELQPEPTAVVPRRARDVPLHTDSRRATSSQDAALTRSGAPSSSRPAPRASCTGGPQKSRGRAPAEWCRPATSGTCAPSRCSCRWWDGPW